MGMAKWTDAKPASIKPSTPNQVPYVKQMPHIPSQLPSARWMLSIHWVAASTAAVISAVRCAGYLQQEGAKVA